jgi:tRNA(Ile)-lysidine synthase
MTALSPSVAAVRLAVAAALGELAPDSLVVVACSGGADSMALARAAAFIAPRAGLRCGLVTVDHGLQTGSTQRAKELAEWGAAAGFIPSLAISVDVSTPGDGPEAAARKARYTALTNVAQDHRAVAVLVGHTLDDQAETVLLALARGGGPRGIAGMPARRMIDGVALLRPLLAVTREQTRAACAAESVGIWDDPQNQEPRFSRVRLRQAMSTLTDALGPDVATNLARTAALIAADTEALDSIAATTGPDLTDAAGTLDCAGLLDLPPAIRTRILRSFALNLGAPGGALSSAHIAALDALVTAWHGQGPTALPGGIEVVRSAGRLGPRVP